MARKYRRSFGYKESLFGEDTYGHDLKAFGDTTGKYFMWDASADGVVLAGNLTGTGAITNTGALTNTGTLTNTGKIDLNGELDTRYRFEIFDDFIQQILVEADTPWILNSGSNESAIDPAIDAQAGGVLKLTTGAADGTTAADAAQLVCHIPMKAEKGGLVFETRLHINTAITGLSVIAGFTDSTLLEEPFSIATATITSTASDAACFVYDDGATSKTWFACATDGDTDDTGNGSTGSAPVKDVFQTLRIEVSADGATIAFYVDGVLKKTLSGAAGVSPDVNLYATVVACSTAAASKSIDVDYIYVGHNR